MGGGGLLDIGLYVISIASWIYGGRRPDAMDALGALADTGSDVAGSVTMRWATICFLTLSLAHPGRYRCSCDSWCV